MEVISTVEILNYDLKNLLQLWNNYQNSIIIEDANTTNLSKSRVPGYRFHNTEKIEIYVKKVI